MTVSKQPWAAGNDDDSSNFEDRSAYNQQEGSSLAVGGSNASAGAASSAISAVSGVRTAASASQQQQVSQRPKSVSQWSVVDVQKWFRRNCGDYYHLYSEKLLEQDITGKKNRRRRMSAT